MSRSLVRSGGHALLLGKWVVLVFRLVHVVFLRVNLRNYSFRITTLQQGYDIESTTGGRHAKGEGPGSPS